MYSLRRRLGALVLFPAVLALSACGAKYDIVIHDNDTIDITTTMWTSDMTREICEGESPLEYLSNDRHDYESTETFTEHNGKPACQSVISGIPLSDVTGEGLLTVRHRDDLYVTEFEPGELTSFLGTSYDG